MVIPGDNMLFATQDISCSRSRWLYCVCPLRPHRRLHHLRCRSRYASENTSRSPCCTRSRERRHSL
ncbi:hypothetical protein NY2A_b242L [Paramecium bursaria Chlorella virus NY2A]|uniref:Uncharacterized protein b242L n=1 Tax=Paramecium bursaria Chlorella virus NY2A TaxID=46021 RepID=A7IWB7_PBCVN|nr:hypothetical protein NY2A_b242L [Paramecium bursaria Chlorella virus NY2A]ABT14641.1 hypothetical protein NY2A_b242L [Paramecium bursaria Chlorella virus NY2A]